MIYDERLIDHMSEMALMRSGKVPFVYRLARRLLVIKPLVFLGNLLEGVGTIFISMQIPFFRHYVLKSVTYLPGSPFIYGNYIRALYWRGRLKKMGRNVLIEQGVIIRFPETTELSEFVLLDKNVLLESRTNRIGRRVHIAENCVISGGGEFIMEDYSCMAHSTAIVTASDTPASGFRGSGPMIPFGQRKVVIGRVIVRKDAFIGMGARILPNVEIGEGAVVASGALVIKNVEPWKIVAGVPAKEKGTRERVTFKDPD
jgi:hypothetical protein